MSDRYYLVSELKTEFGIDFASDLTDMIKQFLSTEQTSKLVASIMGLYYNYRIAFPRVDDLDKSTYANKLQTYIDNSIEQTMQEYSRYYLDMLEAYEKEYDYTSGLSRTVDVNSISVDLPNKVVSEDDIYKYPSNGDKGKTTYTDNSKFIYLKRQYMNQIRDLYREFANKFDDMFLHVYVEEDFEI